MTIKIWKSANKTNEFDFGEYFCLKTLIGHEHSISYLLNIKDTPFIVSCSRDKSIRIWDRETGYLRKTLD